MDSSWVMMIWTTVIGNRSGGCEGEGEGLRLFGHTLSYYAGLSQLNGLGGVVTAMA